jgi:hypothetical protein
MNHCCRTAADAKSIRRSVFKDGSLLITGRTALSQFER